MMAITTNNSMRVNPFRRSSDWNVSFFRILHLSQDSALAPH